MKKHDANTIQSQAEKLAEDARGAIDGDLTALLPGFKVEVHIDVGIAKALFAARESVEADKAARDGLNRELSGIRAQKSAHEATIAEIQRSGGRSDIAAGRAGLLMRDVAELQKREGEIVRALEAPSATAYVQEAGWANHLKEARALAFNRLATELERRLIVSATTINANTPRGGNIGYRWRIGREIRKAVAHGGVF